MANNTNAMHQPCGVGCYKRITKKKMNTEIDFETLYESMLKCRRGVMWKASVSRFCLNGLYSILRLSTKLDTDTYSAKPPVRFTITHPKKREAVSIAFEDRVYQRAINDNILYPTMTRSFIYSNCACQRGKGTDCARDLLDKYLHKFYRKHGLKGYVLQCDVRGYYPNMSHSAVEQMYRNKLEPEIYEKVQAILRSQENPGKGYSPGSQIIQIAGISLLNPLDHYIKERLGVRFYIRYMDDFILIHEDPEFLERCKLEIGQKLNEVGSELHPKKTRIFPLKDGITFLGFTHRLTDTGKIIRIIDSENVRAERRKLQRLVNKCKNGDTSKEKVDKCFEAWIAHASKGNSYKLIQRMKRYYKLLWE